MSTARRALARAAGVALVCCNAAAAGAQAAPIPVVAIGDGRTFAVALASAVRMAVESGAGATVVGAASSNGDRLTADSVRSISRGVVTRYTLIDSSTSAGTVRVRIIAMVSRIAERDAVAPRGAQVAAQGALWSANAAIDSARRADEGKLLSQLFAATDGQPSAYRYDVETGPPVRDGAGFRLRLRLIRSPAEAYASLRDRARAILAAVAGPAGVRAARLPERESVDRKVRPCVSHCAEGERRVLNARAALDATDSLGTFDPPVVTTRGAAPVQTLFPALPTAGGFAVTFTDSSAHHQTFVHVRSTRGYLATVGYLRMTFDDAHFRLSVGSRSVDVLESFRAPHTGQSAPRFEAAGGDGALRVTLAQGFREHTAGGPGAPTTLGSPYVVLALPAAGDVSADTGYVDVALTPAEVAGITELGVTPLGASRRGGGVGTAARTIIPAPTLAPPRTALDRQRPDEPRVPLAVLDAISHAPLSEGDGALAVAPPSGAVVAVGSAVIDPAAPAQACAVARLRAQRELTRFISGSHLEGRIGLTTSEAAGRVQEQFREEISESVAGRTAGAALAAQWTANAPQRCRVALWITDSLVDRRDSTSHPRH